MDTPSSCEPRAQLPKRYDPHTFEPGRYARWENTGAFAAGARPDAEPWAMILPPPNITGSLHMGHAYEHTISDAFARYQRMAGADTLWLPGLDHAGIATQNIVERQLAGEGLTRHDLGRDAFIERTWEWKARSGGQILDQMRQLGASCDWDRLTFTLDEGPQLAVREIFSRLFADGLIYTAQRPIGYCARCATALADIEIDTDDTGAEFCSRCTGTIERKASTQWYLSTAPLAAAARAALESGELDIQPASARGTYLRWLDELQDWCISRQLWWGHRLPIWHGPDGATRSFAPGDPIPDGWEQSPDTLDTWFSSALWPLTTLGWPNQTADLDRYYPTAMLCTGSDLLFFWAIRMMLLCCYASGKSPFRTLYLHGMIRDEHGKKMSKSAGNTIDPLKYLETYGADPLRLALARHARPGADIPFGDDDLAGADALAKKLWSITRFATTHAAGDEPAGAPPLLARWLRSRTEALRADITDRFEHLDLAGAVDHLARFIEAYLSDFYIEAARPGLARHNGEAAALLAQLRVTLRTLCLLAHPIIPFLTEELHAHLTGDDTILDETPWPSPDAGGADPAADAAAGQLRAAAAAARAHKADLGMSQQSTMRSAASGTELTAELAHLAHLELCDHLDGAHLTFGALELWLPAGDALDGPTRDRLTARLDELTATSAKLTSQLDDPNFAGRAPAHIIDRVSAQLAATEAQRGRHRTLLGSTPTEAC